MLSENDTSTNWHRVLNPTIADHMLKMTIKLDIACSRCGSTYTRPDLTYDQALQHVFRYHLYNLGVTPVRNYLDRPIQVMVELSIKDED
jgi:hypothetical protein